MRKELTQEQKDSGRFFTYDQLDVKVKASVYESIACLTEESSKEKILEVLSKHWFDVSGGIYLAY